MSIEVLFVDNHLLVVRKPAGLLTQADRTGDPSLLDLCREYVKQHFNKPGNVFLGLVHRLDRPVSGVMVLARTSKAAARLSTQFRTRQVRKIYWALVQGTVPPHGTLVDQIVRHGVTSHVTRGGKGARAELDFRRLACWQDMSWVEVVLGTGRHHQIRVQFAHYGHPVVGDLRYGATQRFTRHALALHARALTLTHPTHLTRLTFTAEPEECWPAPCKQATDQEATTPRHPMV